MITVTNYTSATAGIDFEKMPAAIKEGHKFFTEFGDLYNDDAEIKATVDLYLRRLNESVEKKELSDKPSSDVLKSNYIFNLWKEYATAYPERRTQPNYSTWGKEKGLDEGVINELYEFNSHYVDTNVATIYTANSIDELNALVKQDAENLKKQDKTIARMLGKKSAAKEPETALGIYENAGCQVIGTDGKPDISPEAIEQLESCTEKLPQTKSFFYHNGKYDAGREELHRQIIDTFKENKPCIVQRQPVAVLTGGPPGSGKSTWLKKYAKWINSENVYHIDADEVRAKLPEYLGWNATATHQETKDIVNTLIDEIGNPCEYDLVYDGTMNKTDNYQPLIDKLKKLGYRVFIIYISVPKGISQKRVLERYKKRGRYVPKAVINEVYERGLDAFEKLIKEADGYIRVDGTTGKIAEKGGMPMPSKGRYPKAADKPTECGCQHNKKAKKAAKHATAEDYIADLTSGPDKLKDLTEKQVIAIGLQFEKKYRNPKSTARDEKRDSVRRLSPTPENLIRWMQHPGKFDLIGVDTFERTSATSDYKREISKQKFWNNLFRIKITV